ncbi:sulfotransferase family protein [Mesoflavibacter zeaxanthinifaciens]|uniref:sulfotransferase family protein n=1 Tax=Mesoflavibacter zeaxanthinifaciens TaxID=393060 RepID=UPI003A941BA6
MKDENLLFIISPPNSGSTLLQQLLLGTDEIASFPESWVMLHPLFQFKPTSYIKTIYRHDLSSIHAKNFIEDSGFTLDEYFREIGEVNLKLYEKRKETHTRYVLDKTPRYYLIIDELLKTFPNAKFVFLVRNPLNTFASTIKRYKSNLKDKLLYLKSDFICSYDNIYKTLSNTTSSNLILIKYEDLCNKTKPTLKFLYDFLEIEYKEDYLNYEFRQDDLDKWGDKSGNVSNFKKPFKVTENIDYKYIKSLNDKINVFDYCNHLDAEMLDFFSYNKSENIKALRLNKLVKLYYPIIKKYLLFNKIKKASI